MQIWPCTLILSAPLSTFIVVRLIFYFHDEAAGVRHLKALRI